MELPNLDPLWTSAFATIILAIITFFYAREMRRMRLESVKPIFSLKPDFTIRDDPMELFLVNNGGIAKEVYIDVIVNGQTNNQFYVQSIPKDGEVDLELHLNEIRNDKGSINVLLKFRDTYEHRLEETTSLNYGEESLGKRRVVCYNNSIEKKLHSISNRLTSVINVLGGHRPF